MTVVSKGVLGTDELFLFHFSTWSVSFLLLFVIPDRSNR